MSNGEVRKVSLQDIQLVQNLIERCLQLYMSEREVVSTLLHQAKIEPGFTELVWQKLEAENQEFFRAYHMRLILKDQILKFNQLLERQVELMCQMHPTRGSSIPSLNGSQIHSLHNNSSYQAPQPTRPLVKPENVQQPVNVIPTVYANGTSSLQPCTRDHAVPANMHLSQNSNSELIQGMNGVVIKSEDGYADDSPFIFGTDNNLLESRNVIGEASVSTFSSESTSQTMNETILDPEENSFRFLGQIPRNFSLSDLTTDFSNGTDMLESYSKSPFLGTDASFLDTHIRTEQQDMNQLDTISEALSNVSD